MGRSAALITEKFKKLIFNEIEIDDRIKCGINLFFVLDVL